MPRYTSETTPDELARLVKAKQQGGSENFSPAHLPAGILKDLKKVNFDLGGQPLTVESLDGLLGVQTIDIPHFLHKQDPKYKNATGKLAFFGALGGNDKEVPVFFLLYKHYDGTLRGFVPKMGNSWDTKTKAAKKTANSKTPLAAQFDAEAIKKEIASRIEFFGQAERGLSFIPDAKL